MRFVSALKSDIRFQFKYGFYILYAFFTALYAVVLLICPEAYKRPVASVIVLTDPAMLGSFFIGGIWLLEKGEGLHGFWAVSPLKPIEYIMSKAVSLAVISTVAADVIVLAGLWGRGVVDFIALSACVFVGSMIFTILGMTVASYARSVNHYMLLVSPLEVVMTGPPVLAAFGITHPISEMLPGMALWRIIGGSIGVTDGVGILSYVVLLLWLAISLVLAQWRIPSALQMEGGVA